MMFFMSLIPATLFVVLGYFILYSSSGSEGSIHKFGKHLSIWVFILAGLFLLGGVIAPLSGMNRMRGMPMMSQYLDRMEDMHERQTELLERMLEAQEG